jgi:hypothetical protein
MAVIIQARLPYPAAAAKPNRWAGESRGRSERGISEAVVLVREVWRVTATSTSSVQAVHPVSCGGGNGHFGRLSAGRAPARPTKGAKKQRAKPPISLFLPREMRRPSWVVPENVPADWGKIPLQRPGMFSGGGMPRRAWQVATDVTAAAFWA